MCGKFTMMATWAEVHSFSQPLIARPSNAPEVAATPMRWAPVMHLNEAGERTMTHMRWGFSAERNGRLYPEHIHARDDKVLTSRLWRPNFEERRGVLIVNSFNEGEEVPTFRPDRITPTGRTKTVQWTIRPKDGSRLAIAVIFRIRTTEDVTVPEFVMCTTTANKGIARFVVADPDQRMPAVLKEEDMPVWLGEVPATPEEIRAVLQTYEDDGAWDMQPESARRGPAPRMSTGPDQGDLF
ncbi:MAG: SOS response-associated peptidase family protein [Hyphomonas sp.]